MESSVTTSTFGFYGHLRRALICSYIAAAAGLCTVATWYTLQDRAERLAASTQHSATLVRALDEHVRRTFNAVDAVLFDIAADIAVTGGVPRIGEAQLHRELRAKQAMVPQVRAMFVYGPNSVLYAGSTRVPTERIDGSSFEHVRLLWPRDAYSPYVGRPHFAPVSGRPSIPVTRRIPVAGVEFGGVIGASLDPDYFAAFYTDLGLSPGQSFALIRADGILILRYPASEVLRSGIDLSDSPLFSQGVGLRTVGAVRFAGGLDHQDRVIAFRQIPDLGLIVTVAQTVDEILAPWRRHTALIATGVAGTLAALFALLWVALGLIQRHAVSERRLHEAELHYRSLVELAPVGIARHANGVIEYANPELARIYGVGSPDELVGRSSSELVLPGDGERVAGCAAELHTTPGATEPKVCRLRRDDGSEAFVEVHAVALREGERVIEQVLVRDVSEARRAAAALRELNETLEDKVRRRTAALAAANEELEAFSYSVSHDLRAPLRAMAGFSAILRADHAGLPAEAVALLARIEAAAMRMSALIEALLRLARVSRHAMRKTHVDLSRLADEIAAELVAANPARKIDVRIAPNLYAQADPTLMHVALQNLLGNALKYSAKQPCARVEFGAETVAGERVHYVRDNGVGFDMQHIDQLFRPFQRLHTGREYEGTGIGLATVARIVRRHGGRIWAEATPDRGATFRFVLPDEDDGPRGKGRATDPAPETITA